MSLFEDDDWFRKLLDDEDILEQMGLPVDMSDEEKEELVEQIESNPMLLKVLESIEDDMYNPNKYLGNEIPFDTEKSPSKQFIQEACMELGFPVNSDNELDEMQVGNTYYIIFPNKKIVTARLENIIDSSTGFDFIFYNIEGAEELISLIETTNEFDEGMFPVPHQFLYSTIIRKVTD